MLKWLWLAVVVLALDQLTKALASAHLALQKPVAVMPCVNLTLMHNTGAAFSFLGTEGGWQRWLFVVIAVAVSAGLLWWLRQLSPRDTWLAAALALVLGGALGNVLDRIVLGYVVDFIDVYYGQWHWPAFNVADSAITIGAVLLLFDAFWGRRRESD